MAALRIVKGSAADIASLEPLDPDTWRTGERIAELESVSVAETLLRRA
jgi:hypothetical protein